MSRLSPLLPALGLGAAAGLGQPPLDAWWATLLAFAIAFRLGRDRGEPRAAFAWWFSVGAGYFTASMFWITSPFLVEPEIYGWMAPFALVLFCGGMALFWGAAGWGAARLAARSPSGLPFLLILALSLAEMARAYVLTGFPWGTPGHVWIGTPLAQAAALVGPLGLTLLTFAAAAALSSLRPLPMLAGAGALGAALAHGLWTLSLPMPADRPVTLRLVQPDADQALKWDPGQAQVFFDRLTALSSVQPAVDLVLWPETALPYTLDGEPGLARDIAASGRGAIMGIGRQRIVGTQGWNALSFLDPSGAEIAGYDKAHLVPFGEYIPFGDLAYDWFGITAFASATGAVFTAGEGPDVLDLGPRLGKVMPLICYEAIFPQDLNAATRRSGLRADWLLQITNDAWFGTLTGPWQHAAQARFRAIEQGLPMVRVANTGVTAVYDARGREKASLPFGIASYLDAALPGALPAPPYARWGDLPVLILLLFGFALSFLTLSREKRA